MNLEVPMTITLANVGEVPTTFRYFRVNFVEKLEAGDEVVLVANTSEEAAYYLALNDETVGLSVTVA